MIYDYLTNFFQELVPNEVPENVGGLQGGLHNALELGQARNNGQRRFRGSNIGADNEEENLQPDVIHIY